MGATTGAWEPTLRPAHEEDLPTCAEIHRVAIDDYVSTLGRPAATWAPAALVALLSHLLATDPDRFLVAESEGRVVGFASAWERGDVWFLAMLFVLPAVQGRGIGTALLEAVLPRPGAAGPDGRPLRLGVATDSSQPVSNALYARYGMIPRMPAFLLRGPATRPDAFPALAAGVVTTPFAAMAAGPPDGPGHRRLVEVTAAIDREVVGYAHPEDHRFLRVVDRRGHLFTNRDGAVLGYGYVRDDGRLGPVAAADGEVVPAILGHLVSTIAPPPEGWSIVVPGGCGPALAAALRAGLRIAEPPTLLCWDRPIADFARYLPIGNALL